MLNDRKIEAAEDRMTLNIWFSMAQPIRRQATDWQSQERDALPAKMRGANTAAAPAEQPAKKVALSIVSCMSEWSRAAVVPWGLPRQLRRVSSWAAGWASPSWDIPGPIGLAASSPLQPRASPRGPARRPRLLPPSCPTQFLCGWQIQLCIKQLNACMMVMLVVLI